MTSRKTKQVSNPGIKYIRIGISNIKDMINSNPINNLATKGAVYQFAKPKSTKVYSNNSTGKSFTQPDKQNRPESKNNNK